MSIATLEMRFNDSDKSILLETGSLRRIDNITREYLDSYDLISKEYKLKLGDEGYKNLVNNNYSLYLNYVKNNDEKLELNILYNDSDEIHVKTSGLDDVKSEIERARKLLYSSKNELFLSLFLLNNNLRNTTYSTIKMSTSEYNVLKNEKMNIFTRDGDYRVPINDVLKYRLSHDKLGPVRTLFEDSLESWKDNILRNPEDELYFLSREMRFVINEYEYRKIPRRSICNLNVCYSNAEVLKDLYIINPIPITTYGRALRQKTKIRDDIF